MHLDDPDACGACHQDVLRHWRQSAHARASFDNPWYRASVDAFRDARGNEASRFCAGCHDPVLLLDGSIDDEVRPEDARAHMGVTCLVCHSTVQSRSDGNGSWVLARDEVLFPDPNDDEEIALHRERLTRGPLRTPALCGSCHRSFLGEEMGNPHHLPGIDDIGSWRRSVFADSHATRLDEERDPETCQSCHMAPRHADDDFAADENDEVASHQVAGAHTAMAAQLGEEALANVQRRLEGAARIDVAAARVDGEWHYPAESAPLRPGAMQLDVVVRNLETGHYFPGGTRDLQDTWIELEVRDAEGSLLAEAGTAHEEREDPTAFRLRSVLLDEEGAPDFAHLVHRFRAAAYDHTLDARDAQVVRYGLTLPEDIAGPLEVRARLRHRRHGHVMQRFACEASRSARGRAFQRASRRLGRTPLDACEPQPITEIADARVQIGAGDQGSGDQGSGDQGSDDQGSGDQGSGDQDSGDQSSTFTRHYDHALGLSRTVQERLDEARPVLALAREVAMTDLQRAQAHAVLARVAARQGRLEEALSEVEHAIGFVGPHPALARIRGDAYAQVWQWESAAAAYEDAAEATPNDAAVWRSLARALGSAGDDEGALDAAVRGIPFSPRDADLLRSQSLAITALERDREAEARAAFLTHRDVDEQPRLLRRCQQRDPDCARDRLPVPTLEMRPTR